MKQVKIIAFQSTKLNPEFNSIQTVEIADTPFSQGGFGIVYHCNSVNGKIIKIPQVFKILIDDNTGSAERGIKTIRKLQEKILSYNSQLKQNNEQPIEKINALQALPQYSFEGIFEGKKIIGYSANLLASNNWFEFGDIFNHDDLEKRKKLRNKFYNLHLNHRLKYAHDLVEGFHHLQKMNFIYADLNPKNFFVNEKEAKLCLIDYEGGAVNDNPETYGKPGEWLAPEIQEQLLNSNSQLIKVDLNTDTWAVAVGIHFMLFHFHPLFYLKVRGKIEMQQYFINQKWPLIQKTNPNFRIEHSKTYDWYLSKLKDEIPEQLIKAFNDTINNGYRNPSLRLSYTQWLRLIQGLMKSPEIKYFNSDTNDLIEGSQIKLTWLIDSNSYSVFIDNGIGEVTGKTEVFIVPINNITYTLKAIGHFGVSEKSIEIKVTPAPKFQEFKSEQTKIKKGESTSLVWEIDNILEARLIGVENDAIVISKTGKQNIKPEQTKTYRVEVIALDGKTIIEKHLSVEVFEEGKISYFKADKQFVFPTIPVTLSWEIQNALKVEIEGIGDFQLSGQTIVQPTVDTTYKLIVTDNFGAITEKLQIKMLPLPVIERLMINTPIVHSHSNINISVADFSSNCLSLPNSVGLKHSTYNCEIDTALYHEQPKIKEINFKTVNIPLMKRIKRVLSLIKDEFTNEKNRKYVTKK